MFAAFAKNLVFFFKFKECSILHMNIKLLKTKYSVLIVQAHNTCSVSVSSVGVPSHVSNFNSRYKVLTAKLL